MLRKSEKRAVFGLGTVAEEGSEGAEGKKDKKMARQVKEEEKRTDFHEKVAVSEEIDSQDEKQLIMLLRELRLDRKESSEACSTSSKVKNFQEGRSYRKAASVNAAEIYGDLQKSSPNMQGQNLQERVVKALSGQMPLLEVICEEVRQLSPKLAGFVYQIIKPGKTVLDDLTDQTERSRIALRAVTDAALIAKQQNQKSCPAIGCILGCWLLGQQPGILTMSLLSTVSTILHFIYLIN